MLRQVPFPDPATTNICFGGADLRTAYVTLSGTGQLVAIDGRRRGCGWRTRFESLTLDECVHPAQRYRAPNAVLFASPDILNECACYPTTFATSSGAIWTRAS